MNSATLLTSPHSKDEKEIANIAMIIVATKGWNKLTIGFYTFTRDYYPS